MIFRVLNVDTDDFSEKVNLFDKSFSNIAQDFRSGQGVLKSLFKTKITEKDIGRLTRYYDALTDPKYTGDAWNDIIAGADTAVQAFAKNLSDGTAGLDDISLSASKATKLFGALKTSIANVGIALATSLLVEVGIKSLIELVDTLIVTKAELEEAVDVSFTAFESAKKDVETIHSELESIGTQIDTLNAKNGLTLVEEGQLKDLREAKRLAEINLAIAERKERTAAIEAGNAILELYRRTYGGFSGEVNSGSVEQRKQEIKRGDSNYTAGLGSDDIVSNIAAQQLIQEEIEAQEKALIAAFNEKLGGESVVSYYGLTEEEIARQLVSNSNVAEDQRASLAKEITQAFKSAEVNGQKFTGTYAANKANFDALTESIEDYWFSVVEMQNNLALLPEEYIESLPEGSSLRTLYDEIQVAADYLTRINDPAMWTSQKFDELFDDEAIADAKDELVEFAKTQEGVGLSMADLTTKYPKLLGKVLSGLETINGKYGTSFGIQDFIDAINSEAGVVNYEELKAQAIAQVNEEAEKDKASGEADVEVKVKAKITVEEFTDWYDSLTNEQREAYQTIRLTPNFVVTDHSIDELNQMIQNQLDTAQDVTFNSLFTGENGLSEKLDKDLGKINTLVEAANSFRLGEFDEAAQLELMNEFPEFIEVLAEGGDVLDWINDKIAEYVGTEQELADGTKETTGILKLFSDAIAKAGDPETEAQLIALRDSVLQIAAVSAEGLTLDIDVEKSSLDAVVTALEEARSETGLTEESVKALSARYKGLEGFNQFELFESTNTGLYLDDDMFRVLEEEYKKNRIGEISERLEELRKQLEETGDQDKAEQANLKKQINHLERLQSQYVGLTSAYNRWIQAQSAGTRHDSYGNVVTGKEDVKELIEQGWATSEPVLAYFDMLAGDSLLEKLFGETDVRKLTADQVVQLYKALDKEIEGSKHSIFDFFTMDDDGNVTSEGIKRFYETVKKLNFDGIITEDGGFDFTGEKMQQVADTLGIGIEAMELLIKASADAGWNVEFESNWTDINGAIELLKKWQEAKLSLETANKANDPTEKEAAEQAIADVASEIDKLPDSVKIEIGFEEDEKTDSYLARLENGEVKADVVANIKFDSDTGAQSNEDATGSIPEKSDCEVTIVVNGAEEVTTLNSELKKLEEYDNKTIRINAEMRSSSVASSVQSNKSKGGKVGGSSTTVSAMASGTAYARGSWGAGANGSALAGELGPETLVRNGNWYILGEHGAEFFDYKKNDIIFNHKQTEELFKTGRAVSGGGRGKAFGGGTPNTINGSKVSGSGTSLIDIDDNKSNSKSKSASSDKDNKEVFDWIEVAIDRIERSIDRLDLKASSAFRVWGERTSNLRKQMATVTDEIELQKKAYDRYIQEANRVGLDAHHAKLVRDGAIDIETVRDEKLAEKIKDYQQWYEKALDCSDAVEELNENLAELYQQNFDNVVTKFEGIVAIIEHEKSLLEESISRAEESGYVVSVEYYKSLMEKERSNIAQLENQRVEMQKALSEAVASGTVKEYSEAWYEMSSEINDVTLSIEEANTAMVEYGNSIRDIEWEVFDLLQERISRVTEETEFLVDLMGNEKLHNENGQLTNEGMATMGMRAMAYNTYMEQAKRYAAELKAIEEDIAKDPNNKELIERKQELVEAQRDAILAAEDEKQAIVDLVEEGIELEIDALDERIDKYKESIESARDLYEYQQKIAESTKEIASLEKQMQAYAGDDSEETKATIQKLKVSLEDAQKNLTETEYDHFIEDQEKMLDDLLEEYEDLLNARLDDVNALISDMIGEVNEGAGKINSTLEAMADRFGFELSDAMSGPWSGEGDVVAVYGREIMNSISDVGTKLSENLASIDKGVWAMMAAIDSSAKQDVAGNAGKVAGYASGAYRISRNQMAWTQEGRKAEAIIRPSDGAILTPLMQGDSILSADATANLFGLANNPAQFIKDNLDLNKMASGATAQTYVGNNYTTDISMQVNLPNVTDYDQFIYAMQHDANFERMIRAMTVDKMFGGSSMNKYRY